LSIDQEYELDVRIIDCVTLFVLLETTEYWAGERLSLEREAVAFVSQKWELRL